MICDNMDLLFADVNAIGRGSYLSPPSRVITSAPRYGRSAAGTTTEPSLC